MFHSLKFTFREKASEGRDYEIEPAIAVRSLALSQAMGALHFCWRLLFSTAVVCHKSGHLGCLLLSSILNVTPQSYTVKGIVHKKIIKICGSQRAVLGSGVVSTHDTR